MSVLSTLEDELTRKKRAAEATAEQHKAEVLHLIPELDELDNEYRALLCTRFGLMRRGLDYSREDELIARNKAQKEALLRQHNIPDSYLEPQYSCKFCNDTGYVEGKRCSCLESARINALYSGANIDGADKQTFDTFDLNVFEDERRDSMRKLYTYCKNYATSFSNSTSTSIVFCGQTGVGKTFLLNCIGGEVLRRGFSVFATEAYDIANTFADRETENERKKMLCSVDLLLIDELGIESILNNITIENLFYVINERYRKGKPIIISTNMMPEQLQARYTERITSRLFDKQKSVCFLLQGKDLRSK